MKMRIVIEVERVDGPVTTSDLCYAADKVACCVEVGDERLDPLVGSRGRDGALWGYAVEEVSP